MKKAKRLGSIAFLGLVTLGSILTACGGGGETSTSATVATGQFIDSPVQGLRFTSGGQSGFTNASGEFTYEAGQPVTFYIGGISFSSTGGAVITPLTVFGTTNFNDTRVVNLARLLQTLDQDGIPGNGITILSNAHTAAAGLTIDFSSPDFDTQVGTLVTNGGGSASLISTQDAIAHMQSQLSIAGSWYSGNPSEADNVIVVTFFDDGTYVLSEDGAAAAGGGDGMERGTYTWNPVTKAFTATPAVDTNGDWGFSHPEGSLTVQTDGNSMTLSDSAGNSLPLTRVTNTSGSIVGSWYAGSTTGANDLVILTFFGDGSYVFSQDGNIAQHGAGGTDGIERGTYTWNSSTGAFTATPATDTTGQWGLSHPQGSVTVEIRSDTLIFTDSVEGTNTATRIP